MRFGCPLPIPVVSQAYPGIAVTPFPCCNSNNCTAQNQWKRSTYLGSGHVCCILTNRYSSTGTYESFYFNSPAKLTFNNIVKQKGFPSPKYKASGNLLQQYCCNIVWQYCHSIAAILDFTCKLVSGSIVAITHFGNIAAILPTVHKSSFGNITAILPGNIINDQYCRSSGNNTYEIMA